MLIEVMTSQCVATSTRSMGEPPLNTSRSQNSALRGFVIDEHLREFKWREFGMHRRLTLIKSEAKMALLDRL